MDPSATLMQLIDAYCTGDFEECRDMAIALRAWVGRGGFPPKLSDLTAQEQARLVKILYDVLPEYLTLKKM